MNHFAVLDGITHRQLAVTPEFQFEPFDGLGSITVFPNELDAAHKEFAIFIRKNPESGQFFLSALLGNHPQQTIYARSGQWHCRYIPLMARRGPFLMNVSSEDVVHLCINLADKRVNENGNRLFDDQGKPTPYTERVATVLNQIHLGHKQTELLMMALARHQLIEPIAIAAASPDHPMLNGLYSINADKLKALPSDTAATLNRENYLQWAYFIASSSSNIVTLLES